MAALTVVISNLFLSDVTAVSVLLVVINMLWKELPRYPSSSLTSSTDTVFLLLMKTCVTFFSRTAGFLTVSSMPLTVLSYTRFNKLNKSINYTPDFLLILHTFGRNLKWNSHIHCLNLMTLGYWSLF